MPFAGSAPLQGGRAFGRACVFADRRPADTIGASFGHAMPKRSPMLVRGRDDTVAASRCLLSVLANSSVKGLKALDPFSFRPMEIWQWMQRRSQTF